ncbi:MAG: tyrosine-type recombinase/integrase [Janthinobacterium lividum]
MACVNLREKPLRNGTVSLVLDYHEQGVRHKQSLKIYVNPQDAKSRNPAQREAYQEAYRIAHIEKNKVEKRLLHLENDIAPTYDRNASFLEYVDGLVPTRNHNWRSMANHLRQFSRGKLPCGNLTEEWVSRFQEYLVTQVQASTARSLMGLFITALNQAVRDKVLPDNPSKYVRKVRVKEKPPKCLNKEQIEVLLQNRQGIPDWIVQPFLFSCYTGLRISDIETLVWGEVHGNGVSPEGLSHFKLVKEQVKTQDTVQIPLTAQAITILDTLGLRYKSAAEALDNVFILKSRSQTKRYVDKWRQQAGVFFTYHSSRHTFGTTLQTAGVDIYTTSKLLGHRKIETTTKYARVIDRQRDQAIEKLGSYLS